MKTIKSKAPFFSAWKKFNWDENTWGAVISMNVLKRLADKDEKVKFKFRNIKQSFEVSAKVAYDFVVQNKTQTTIQIPQRAGVIPIAIMKKVKNENNSRDNNVQ